MSIASCPVTVHIQEEPGLVLSILSYRFVRDSNKIIIHDIKFTNNFAVYKSNLYFQDNACTFKWSLLRVMVFLTSKGLSLCVWIETSSCSLLLIIFNFNLEFMWSFQCLLLLHV